jgi:tetratricopeptide (TPR) repeat protein
MQLRHTNKPRSKWVFVVLGLLCLSGIGRSFSMHRKPHGLIKGDGVSVKPSPVESSVVIPTTSGASKCGTSNRLVARPQLQFLVAENPEGMPKSSELEQFQAAEHLIHGRKYSQAVQTLNNAIKLHPECPELIFLRGYAFLDQEDQQQAIRDFERTRDAYEKTIERGDKQPMALTNLGSVLIELGKLKRDKKIFQQAEEVLRKALELPLCPSGASCELAELLELQERAVEALEVLSGRLQKNPTDQILVECYQDVLHRTQQQPRPDTPPNHSSGQTAKFQPSQQGR